MDERPTPGHTRREGVRAIPTTLADGQDWALALPTTRFRPSVVRGSDSLGRPTETIQLATEHGYPAEVRRAIARLRSECEAGTHDGRRDAIIGLGVALLLRAHEVGPAFAATLFDASPADFPRLAEAILDVVTTPNDHEL